VGGSPRPLIHSLNCQRPEYVIYFTSRQTRFQVREAIEPALEFRPRDHDLIVTPDAEDLPVSVARLLRAVPELLEQWGLSFADLRADYTGGTKTMAAAVVLALTGHGCLFSYVGGVERDKAGTGVVLDGHERMLYLKNPWDVLAVERLRDIELLFNRCRFQSAAETARAAARVTEEKRPLFTALEHAAEAYGLWDGFHYKKALKAMQQAGGRLTSLAACSDHSALCAFAENVQAGVTRLDGLCREANQLIKANPARHGDGDEPADGRALVLDLLANAVRRAECEHKYDDAVARLYSVVEKIAKLRLQTAWGIDNSAVDANKVPEGVCPFDLAACRDAGGRIVLPLHKSFELLTALGDEVGRRFTAQAHELDKVLPARNLSPLAHGWQPVTCDLYERLLALALTFCAARPDDLPPFPRMDWGREGI
jgi:CRISPR-associated protein (TIGR02710 family)